MRVASLIALLVCLCGANPPAVAQQGAVAFTVLPEATPERCRNVLQNIILPVLNPRTSGLTISYPTTGPGKGTFQVAVTPQGTQALFELWDRAVRELRGPCGCPSDTWLPRDRTATAVKDAIHNFLNDGSGVEFSPGQPGNRYGLVLRPKPESPCPDLPPAASGPPREATGQAGLQSGVLGPTANLPPAVGGLSRAVPEPAAVGTPTTTDPVDRLQDLIEMGKETFGRMIRLEQTLTEKIEDWNSVASGVDAQRLATRVQILGAGIGDFLLGAALGATIAGTVAAVYLRARRRSGTLPEAIGRLATDLRSAVARQDTTQREFSATLARHRELLENLLEQAGQRTPSPPAGAALDYVLPSPRHSASSLSEAPSGVGAAQMPVPQASAAEVNETTILQHYNELVAGCGRDRDEEAFIAAYHARWAIPAQGNRLRLVQVAPPRGSVTFLVVVTDRSRALIYPAVSFRQAWAAVAGTPAADTVFEGVFIPLHGSGRYRVASAALGRVDGSLVRIDKPGAVEI